MRIFGSWICLLAILAGTGAGALETGPPTGRVDLLIRNGLVLDGLGNEPVRADLVIDGGRIRFVGEVAATLAPDRVIDAQGRIVAPGFIDPHSHGDPFETPAFENFLAMGVTTITLGQDGASPAVDDLGVWLAEVAQRGIGVNLAMFVGHGTLREQAGIGARPEPGIGEIEALQARLDAALAHTFGLSLGLEYPPGLHAGELELRALARVVGARDRLIMSHMRNEDDDQVEASLAELIRQGSHARVHVAHIKSVYGRGSARAEAILLQLDLARRQGVRITADLYPYTASYTGIGLLFPVWAKTRADFEVARETRYEALADHLRTRVMARNGPEATLLGTAPYTGKTLADLERELGKPFERVLIDDIGPDGASAAYFVMDDALQDRLLLDPHVAICSDGSPTGFHPRGHGTFARVIEEHVVARGLLELPEMVRKMTSLPADIIGLRDRGRIAPGMAADLVIFDPAQVRARATYVAPLQLAEGFDLVLVNGRVARDAGVLDATLHGEVLKPDSAVR
jgi:N-acyl-D-aspartate/D-glutamate deacylase